MLEFLHHKNTETRYLVIILSCRAGASEQQVALSGESFVDSEVGLLLWIDWYSYDKVLSGAVLSLSVNEKLSLGCGTDINTIVDLSY